jgi:hypothetical protein
MGLESTKINKYQGQQRSIFIDQDLCRGNWERENNICFSIELIGPMKISHEK